MNIGFNTLFLIPGQVGGTQTYAKNLISALADTGPQHNFYIFCNKENYNSFPTKKNITQVLIPIKARNRTLRFFAEQLILPWYCSRYNLDILHSLGYSSPIFIPTKSVTTIHDLNWKFFPQNFSSIEQLAWRISTTISAYSSDHIITDSNRSSQDIVNLYGLKSKSVSVVLCGIPRKSKSNPIKTTLKKFKIKQPFALTVLSPYPHKNLKTAINVWSKFTSLSKKNDSYQLVVCGTRPKKTTYNKNIVYLPPISNSELATLYQTARVFIFPSLYEGFGFPPLEAMNYGTPVISSRATALTQVVGKGGVLVDPLDVDSYVREISQIWDNTQRRKALIKKGKKWVKRFDWNVAAKKTLEIYKKANTHK